ncbi:ABC transporter ATP-binding protein [Paenibacillus yanchengensis]|uniref:ABC transporter ATP-binding protein n=1 Tax=Paenibacillus yanchengensis TaxID=2035833 RepID=A0ABW4YLP2_9BACL
MQMMLEVKQLTGGYNPRRPVLHEVDFHVKPGEMVGLIGLNGAGKSTTIKHILGLMEPQQGNIKIADVMLKENSEKYRSAFAYVPETPILFDELTVEEHLRLTGMAYGVEDKRYEQSIVQLLEQFQMTNKRQSFASHLSKGMKQKVMIMNALLASPELFIIDEPFLGLDPIGIRSLLEQLVQLKNDGAAILMSSHILSTVETYCDRLIILHQGKVVAQGTMEMIRHKAGAPFATANLEELFYHFTKEGAN